MSPRCRPVCQRLPCGLGFGFGLARPGPTTCRSAGWDLHIVGPWGRYGPSDPHDVQACRLEPAHCWPPEPLWALRPARRACLPVGTCTLLAPGTAMGLPTRTTCRFSWQDLHIVGPGGRHRPSRPDDMQVWDLEPAHCRALEPLWPARVLRHAGLPVGTCALLGPEADMGRLGPMTCRSAGWNLRIVGPGGRDRPSWPIDMQVWDLEPAHCWHPEPLWALRPARRAGSAGRTCTLLGLGADIARPGPTTCRSAGQGGTRGRPWQPVARKAPPLFASPRASLGSTAQPSPVSFSRRASSVSRGPLSDSREPTFSWLAPLRQACGSRPAPPALSENLRGGAVSSSQPHGRRTL